jgi:uncharacterized protein
MAGVRSSWRSSWLPVTILVATAAIAACGGDAPTQNGPRAGSGPPPSFLSIRTQGGQPATLHVEIADDDESRARGLMGREELPADQGMAFVWEEPTTTTFWMKDTPLPLSIAFWDTEGLIVAIEDMEPCEAEPCPSYGAPEPFIGAVEVNQGWFEANGVAVGDHVELEIRAYA